MATTGLLHYLRNYAFGYNSQIGIDIPNRVLFLTNSIGFDFRSYKYTPSGVVTLVDTENPHAGLEQGVTIDPISMFAFVGDNNNTLYSYSYDNAGNMNLISNLPVWTAVRFPDLSIDVSRRLIIAAANVEDIAIFRYSVGGILSLGAQLDLGFNCNGSGVDTTNRVAFTTRAVVGSIISYYYNNIGAVNYADIIPNVGLGNIKVDTTHVRLGFAPSGGDGLYPFTYFPDGSNLTLATPLDMGGSATYVDLDIPQKVVFLANLARGIDTFYYNYLTGELTHVSNNVGSGGNIDHVIIDTENHLVFATGANGLDVFRYEYEELYYRLDASASPTSGKKPLKVNFDYTIYVMSGDRIVGVM